MQRPWMLQTTDSSIFRLKVRSPTRVQGYHESIVPLEQGGWGRIYCIFVIDNFAQVLKLLSDCTSLRADIYLLSFKRRREAKKIGNICRKVIIRRVVRAKV